jgi:hypothetical protein
LHERGWLGSDNKQAILIDGNESAGFQETGLLQPFFFLYLLPPLLEFLTRPLGCVLSLSFLFFSFLSFF